MSVEPEQQLVSNRRYMIALSAAIVLFLLTLTAVIIVLMIARGREDRRADEFSLTLTGVWGSVSQTQTAIAITPTPAPPVVAGEYPFAAVPDSPAYRAAPDCAAQILGGQVVDVDGEPLDGFSVQVWGDYLPLQTVKSGAAAGQERGRWQIALPDQVSRRAWVQLVSKQRTLSAPLEIVFNAADCERSQAEIVFQQVAPLD